MKRHVSSPAQYRLEDRALFVLMPLMLIVLLGIVGWSHFHLHPTGMLGVVCAAIASLPMIAAVVIFALYLREETDEFQKSLRVWALLWSTGATLTAITFSVSLEQFTHVPRISIGSAQTLFFVVFMLASVILRWRYR